MNLFCRANSRSPILRLSPTLRRRRSILLLAATPHSLIPIRHQIITTTSTIRRRRQLTAAPVSRRHRQLIIAGHRLFRVRLWRRVRCCDEPSRRRWMIPPDMELCAEGGVVIVAVRILIELSARITPGDPCESRHMHAQGGMIRSSNILPKARMCPAGHPLAPATARASAAHVHIWGMTVSVRRCSIGNSWQMEKAGSW